MGTNWESVCWVESSIQVQIYKENYSFKSVMNFVGGSGDKIFSFCGLSVGLEFKKKSFLICYMDLKDIMDY
jgi:hypothetical protein